MSTSKTIVARNDRTPKATTRSQPTRRPRAPSLGANHQRAGVFYLPSYASPTRQRGDLNICPLCGAHSVCTPPVACLPNARATSAAIRCALPGVHLHQSCGHCGFVWVVDVVMQPGVEVGAR